MSAAAPTQAPAHEFLRFVDASPSPFHAVHTVSEMLRAAGFEQLHERDAWGSLRPNGKYFVTRNQSALVAFCVGGRFEPGNGFSIVAAHTDSPCLKIKPISKIEGSGFLSVGVETYGGGLWHTWFDRDLAIAGRVIVKSGDGYESRLLHVNRPVLRIPSLAIHLDREIYSSGFKFNFETHLAPILATAAKGQLEAPARSDEEAAVAGGTITEHHHPALLRLIASELSVPVEDVHDFELVLCDAAPATVGGLAEEFIFAPRLDNLMMSFVAISALLRTADSLADETCVRMVSLFDNEEVGSQSLMGAGSTFAEDVTRRVSTADRLSIALRRSMLVSADMAHGVHPNFPEKHEARHRPALHKGVVLKHNANQRYASNAVTVFLLREIARRHSLPLQEFVVRQDMGCGSTIGPILATGMGMRTVDVGIAQLSMHSIREMCGTDDVHHALELFSHFFRDFAALDASLALD